MCIHALQVGLLALLLSVGLLSNYIDSQVQTKLDVPKPSDLVNVVSE